MRFFPIRKEISRGGMAIFAGISLWETLVARVAGERSVDYAAEVCLRRCSRARLIDGHVPLVRRDQRKPYKSKKIPAMSDFVDSSMIEEAQKLAGFKA
jgi:hypothetical protein